jgi:hypothetical protein
MKISYIGILLILVFNLYSCKNDKNSTSNEPIQKVKKDSIREKDGGNSGEISLESVKSEVPSFANPEVATFIANTKKYFEEIAEATQKGNSDKVLELQLKAVDIATEFQKVKNKLDAGQQKQLTDWYMKLVEAASK